MDPMELSFYATPGRFTTLDDTEGASDDVREVVAVVRGLLIYDAVAKPFYGVDLPPAQAEAIHERDTARLLATVRACNPLPLSVSRPPTDRVGARCHAFSRVTVALLRAAGVPARARCGFGTYFRPGWFEDHWVAEYWDTTADAWRMVDAQLDETWCKMLGFAGDTCAISEAEFVTAGRARQAWRRGDLDASRCGLSAIGEHGAFWIAGNMRLDLAALNKVEMLPWDVWGAGWSPHEQPTDTQLEFFDGVATLTAEPDIHFAELRTRYESDDALRMNGTVFNVLRGRTETVSSDSGPRA